MRDIKDVVAWLEEELAHFEMAVEQYNYVSKAMKLDTEWHKNYWLGL